jgi:hypothetical protein
MTLKSKIILVATAIAAIAVLAMIFRPSQDDGSLASSAVSAVSGDSVSLYRVTETSFRMSPASATLCRAAPTQRPPHAGYHCHVFANERARKPIQSGNGEYPAGSVIVKQKYYTQFAKKTALFTIMRKMDDGYDDENGNWEYSVVNSTGKKLLSSGREASCIACHAQYADTDFVTRVYLDP